jgi:hypothetical protein
LFLIFANNQLGRRMPARTADFAVVIDGETPTLQPVSCECELSADSAGVLRATYRPPTRGAYTVSVLCRGAHVHDSPFSVTVGVGASPRAAVGGLAV